MILYSFLGLGKFNNKTNKYEYERVKYSYNDTTIETEYFPYAAKEFLKPEKVYIVLTEKSLEAHFHNLAKKLKFKEIIIPEGRSESEIWEIFTILCENIENNSEIVLDITHGFRSQPILALATALYLQSSSGVRISKIIYGAYEARNEDGTVPVFDLSVFIHLIQWSSAVRDFLKYQKADEIKFLLSKIHRDTYVNNFPKKSESLQSVGRILNNLSFSLSLSHIPAIFENAYILSKENESLIKDLQNIQPAMPLSRILKNLSDKIELISKSERNWFSYEGIEAQLSIIQWYLETSNYQQAITLMRELLITVFAINQELSPIEDRKETEDRLGKLLSIFRETHTCEHEEFVNLFNQITQTRNEINHAGMRPEFTSPDKLVKSISKHFDNLKLLLQKPH